MKKIKIKNTDLELSAIGFGTVNAGLSWDHEEAFRMFENYLEAGGNLIDTAHVYSDWIPGETARAERVVGEWIRDRKRTDDFILMTKGGHPRSETMHISRLSRQEMEADLNDSLEKLGVDCVDIYFYHRDDVNRSVEELVETMEEFRRNGKIRYYGCSNWTTARMKEADAYCKSKGYRGFVANQDMYNIGVKYMNPFSDPTMVVCDEEMLQYHRESDNLLMPYMGVCSGFFHKLRAKGSEAVQDSCYHTAPNLEIAGHIYRLCEQKGYTITQALMGFFAVQDFDVLPLASADDQGQFEELSKAMATEFDAADYGFLKKII
ncbi:aldo/keto reductase [Clostridium sp. AN503]|uniref:aldo/keto reductase n=1 Tax=Clostridium sp. AN503 TaxID=3160598 RepID=UPI003457C312